MGRNSHNPPSTPMSTHSPFCHCDLWWGGPHSCEEMGHSTAPHIWISQCALHHLAALEGHETQVVALLAMGKCMMGGMSPPPGKDGQPVPIV